MILIDTSVWIDHWRRRDPLLAKVLAAGEVWMHPFILGELALGTLVNRAEVLIDLQQLPAAATADPGEVLQLIERHELANSGLGYVDVHLLASARIMRGSRVWSKDKRLAAVARRLGVGETLH